MKRLSSNSVPASGLLLRILLTLSVAAVALDEFNIVVGFFSLKASLILFAASLVLFAATRTALDRRIGLLGCVAVCLLLSALYRLADLGEFFNDGDIEYTIASRTSNLLILLTWTLCLTSSLSSRDLQRSYSWLFWLLLIKCFYIFWLFLNGDLDAIFWLPTGEPRFALNRGGMTPNQAGATWLTVFLFFLYRANADRKLSRLKIFFVLSVSMILGTMSGSRSFLIGVFLASFFWLSLRYRTIGVVTGLLVAAAGTVAYLVVFPDRGADESALGRFDKWLHSLENIGNNILLGSGVGSDSASHNTVLQILSETGFVGLAAFLILISVFLIWRGRFLTTSFFAFVMPYLFFLLVDIGLLQWQTWLLLATAVVLGREKMEAIRKRSSTCLPKIGSAEPVTNAQSAVARSWH